MRKKSYKGKLKRVLPVLLAAALWIEGTFGAVYAAEPVLQAEQTVSVEEDTASEETSDAESEGIGTPEEATAESEKPETPAKEETGENGESEKNGGSDETEEPEEGELSEAEEEETSGVTEGEDTDAPDTVSENDPEQEEEEESLEELDYDGECALGEPPLMTGYAKGNTVYSYSSADGARSGESGKLQTPSTVDIIKRYKAYPWKLNVENSYNEKPSTKKPYKAGELSDKSLENVLNLLNFIRYVAGIPSDVTLDEEYVEKAQAGALLNCVNGQLSHKPGRPSGFPDELYQNGYDGCFSSNIASGYGTIAKSLLNGWMYDGDSTNIASMGHRRWVLNPSMTQTGFGAVGAYSNMYAFDRSGSTVTDFVAWPAQNMPIELMNGSGTPWTVSLGSDYGKADFRNVTVTLQNLSNNKTYTFSGTKAEGVFKVNTDGYGMSNCIIFRPNGVSYNKASQFRVTITGLTKKDGTAAEPLSYNVDFFSLSDQPAEVQQVMINKKSMHLLKDVEGKQEETLLATVKPSNAADKTLIWKSGDEKVATVDENGNVKAAGVGETTVSVKAVNGTQAVCDVKVSQYSLVSEGFDEETGSLSFDLATDKDKEPQTLTVQDGGRPATDRIQWKSENPNVAEVDDAGIVTPISVGETEIWANVENGLAVFHCEVRVEKSALSTLQLREETCSLVVRKDSKGNTEKATRQLRVYFSPADSKWKSVRWSADDETVATVSNTGLVTAIGAGTAKITATVVDENGKDVELEGKKAQAVCTMTVKEQVEAPTLSVAEQPVALTNTQTTLKDVALPTGWSWKEPDTALAQFAGGQPKKFTAVYQPEESQNMLPAESLLEVHFLTVKSLSLGIREDGETVSSLQSEQEAECYVNYFGEEILERFEGAESPLKGNDAYQKYKQEIEKNLKWVSSNPKVAEVESAGNGVKVTAKAAGTTTLKAQVKLGKKTFSASRKITVLKTIAGTLTVTGVEGFDAPAPDAEEQRYTGLLSDFKTAKANQVNSKITLTLPGAKKVTAKSSNTKVVTVKTSVVEGDSFVVSLVVKAAGTARITLTGNDAAKTSRDITLVVADAKPGLSEETVTVNTQQNVGALFAMCLAVDPSGESYEVTDVTMASDQKSQQFTLSREGASDSYRIKAKSGTKNGTYKVNISVRAGGTSHELPLNVKVVSTKPKCKVKQVNKLNLFYKGTRSLLEIDTGGAVIDTGGGKPGVTLKSCADYIVESEDGKWYLRAREGATLKSVKKGTLTITLENYREALTVPFTVKVEKKIPKIAPDITRVTLYPKVGIENVLVGLKNAQILSWETVQVEKQNGVYGRNYKVEVDRENKGIRLSGENLNRTETLKMPILLKDDSAWTEPISCTLTIKVSLGQPAIALGNKTLQLNANPAYVGYDAAATTVKWKDGGNLDSLDQDKNLRVSVYCDSKDAKAKALVQNSQVIFSVTRGPAEQQYQKYQVAVRLNNKDVASGTYKFIVQAAKGGKVWKTPLTLKIVNTAPKKAVKITAKGSIDVLNREKSFITLTPSLKALNGKFITLDDTKTPGDRVVELTGRDAHLFEAKWDESGKKIELRAKQGEILVTKYQYSVTPVIKIKNANGDTEELTVSAVKFQVKQGSAKLTAAPKTALLYSGSYNSVQIDLRAALKGAPAPEIKEVTLINNTGAFALSGYTYDKETGKGTLQLQMKNTGHAVKGKTYTLQLQVRLSEQADNVKPVTVKYKVKVK